MKLPKRKSIRLKEYDYSRNGAYFVTICSHNREYLFGEIVGGCRKWQKHLQQPPTAGKQLMIFGQVWKPVSTMVNLLYKIIH